MTTSALLFSLFAVAVGVAAYVAGLRAGERAGRRQTQSDLKDIARAAAAESNQQAREAYEHATGQAVERLQAVARSDRELGQAKFAETAVPLRESLAQVQELAREMKAGRDQDHGALRKFTESLTAQMAGVVGSSESLRQALKGDRQARGKWGEFQLQRLVERAGLIERCDFETQVTKNGTRPDLLIHLPGGAALPVDAKVPMDDYLTATDVESPELQHAALAKHADRVKAHAAALGKREYPGSLDGGPPFTVMFLPMESLLSEAIRHEPDLLQYAADRNVVLATPHTLMGLLWSINATWRHETSSRNAEGMRNAGLELEKRLDTFLGRFADVGSQLHKTTDAYNRAVGSAESRLTPQLRQLRKLGGQPEEQPTDRLPAPVDVVPRPLFGEELDLRTERELL